MSEVEARSRLGRFGITGSTALLPLALLVVPTSQDRCDAAAAPLRRARAYGAHVAPIPSPLSPFFFLSLCRRFQVSVRACGARLSLLCLLSGAMFAPCRWLLLKLLGLRCSQVLNMLLRLKAFGGTGAGGVVT